MPSFMVFRENVRCTLESAGWVAKYQCLLGEGFLKADTVQQQPEPLSRLVLGDTTAGGSQAKVQRQSLACTV